MSHKDKEREKKAEIEAADRMLNMVKPISGAVGAGVGLLTGSPHASAVGSQVAPLCVEAIRHVKHAQISMKYSEDPTLRAIGQAYDHPLEAYMLPLGPILFLLKKR